LVPVYKQAEKLEDIMPIGNDSLVKPVIYSKVPDLSGVPVNIHKEKFVALLLPSILVVQHQIKEDRKRVKKIMDNAAEGNPTEEGDSLWLLAKFDYYKADGIEDLYMRMKPHPVSIVLAQAAIESGWGRSRFFRKANNVFGVWSYNSSEPRMRASLSGSRNPVYVREYPNLMASILDYYRLLGSARAYREFRAMRMETSDPYLLVPYLVRYSERKTAYTSLIATMIKQNNFTKYDEYKIDPEYFKLGDETVS